jgi:very-short-patch-repair endonuclease
VADVDRLVNGKASRQHGIVTASQALELGMTQRQVNYRVATKVYERVHPLTYRLIAVPRSFQQSVMAACLAADGVACRRCAAVLFGLRGFERSGVEITVPSRSRRKLDGVSVYRADLVDAERTRIGVIPVTAPARILLDLAGMDPVRVERALNDALFRKLVSLPNLVRFLKRAGGRGRPGSARLRELLAPFLAGQAPTESSLEDDLVDVLRRYGLPEPVRQYPLRNHRLDGAYPALKVNLEADGGRWHDPVEDAERDATCRALGWHVERFSSEDIRDRPAVVAARVAYLLGVKRAA